MWLRPKPFSIFSALMTRVASRRYAPLLAEHGGDVAKLKEAEPWLFSGVEPQGGATGLEPAGAAKADDKEMRRWREIAGLEDEE